MGEVTLSINGRNYNISCDDGQERRVRDLAAYVDQRMREMARAGAAPNDSQLLVLTTILLADEIFELRDQQGAGTPVSALPPEEDAAIAGAIDKLAERINAIAERMQGA